MGPVSKEHAEARRSAAGGHRFTIGRHEFIPGLYGLRLGWVPWDDDAAVRLARVDAFFGAA
ncbi:hypothetical protein [Microbacterium oxydans]|uniref:hypothetical protein n=1 Tax=Microbacterium oxydans TaxID=82380 RepID=UPI00226B3648|nr:hypothetical protein [Microbacterium oxydans]WAA67781.1 hypothetical protein MME74_08505 [Microbacterium oxydans]